MNSESASEIASDHWWLHRRTDDEHFVFTYEYSSSLLCHVQHTSDWLVRIDRADGTILFSQHDLRSRAAAFALAESVIEPCTMLHRDVVTERSQARKPMYVNSQPTGSASASNQRAGRSPDTACRASDFFPRQPSTRPRDLGHRDEFR